jgi:hypothetical protein
MQALVDMEPVFEAAGGRSDEDLAAYLNRLQPTKPQQQRYEHELQGIGSDRYLCAAFGIDFDKPQYTMIARAYAAFQAGCK